MNTHAALHDAQAMRHADRELLSLALMHARNRTLAWLAVLEPQAAQTPAGLMPAWWLAGRAGWYQERWIAHNVERSRGAAADATRAPLASIEPDADRWWAEPPRDRPDGEPTDVRSYLAETLEITLDLLAGAGDDDDALHWFRAALFEEDALVLPLAALAQARRVAGARALLPERALRPVRPPVWFAAQRWRLGSPPGGYVPAAERWAHEEPVPEFEIDAQPITWQQFAEFVEDGGYDDATLWSDDGARWLQAQGRRTPRDVEQLRHGVLLQRFGQLVRAPAGEAASMLSWHEADAWCRWAGRRLPTEVEWELAASQGASRGVTWGDVPEWTAGRARAWPGGPPVGGDELRVQRGVAWFEPRRLAHPKARRFIAPERDEGFAGFRSCAP
jgi:iron(II)-dependent oxidoreductase